ncbi:MAG: putative ABC transporter permease subunit [Bacillota bacterium]|jgi:ABC-2 type transport system permease protein
MSLLFKLIAISLKTTFGLSALRDKYLRRKQELWQPLLVGLALVMGFGTFSYFFMQVAYSLVQVGDAYGQPEIVYTIAILGTQLLMLIMGLFLVISAFFFSNDLSILVPLPLKPAYIVTAKLATVVVNEYLTSLFLFTPAVLAFARLIGAGVAHFASVLVVFLLTPILPLVIASMVALAVMRVINRKHRDTLMIVASLLFVVILLGVNFSMQSAMGKGDPQEMLQRLISTRYGLLEAIGNRFPPAIWATKAIAQAGSAEGWLNLLAFIGITAVGLLVLYLLSGRLFYAGLIGGEEVSGRGKRLTKRQWQDHTSQSSALSALFWREWKLFIRTPVFALNGFMGALVMPVALVFPLIAQGELARVLSAVQTEQGAFIAALAVAAMIIFMGSINTITSTSVSREGKFFYVSKMIPVAPELQARAKMLHGLVGAVVSAVPIAVTYAVIVRPQLLHLLAAVLIGLSGTVMGMALGLYIDMRAPKLHWTNPQQAVKQNLNAVIPMFAIMLVLGLFALLTVWLFTSGVSPLFIYLLLLLLFVIPGLLLYRFTVGAADRLYHRLDI